MSADLFAIFGTPDSAPGKEELEERWDVPQGGVAFAAAPPAQLSQPNNSHVLFDADDAEAEAGDDFGDFEDVEAVNEPSVEAGSAQRHVADISNVASVSQQVDLLDLGNDTALEPQPEHRHSTSLEATQEGITTNEIDDWGDFEASPQGAQPEPRLWKPSTTFHASTQATPGPPPQNVPSSKDDNWEDFEDWSSEPPPNQHPPNDSPSADSPAHPADLPNEPRPTNIPPPTTLLQLLPTIFQSLQTQSQPSPSTPPDFLATSIVLVFTVSARLLAGRHLRPKRDTYLAQSLRIGPSTPGSRSGGMKLTSLNKSELLHSERDAAAVCDAWSSHTHTFTSIVSQSEHRRPWMTLNVNMRVSAGPGYGTLEAREPCVLCAVRREERIAGVDFDADDVFGEYWTEGWGHSDCRAFWYAYRGLLEQR